MGFTLNQLEQERQIRKLQKKEDKDTKDYEQLSNLPKINNVELKGDKTTSDLGINATNVMMSDGVTSVEDALDRLQIKSVIFEETTSSTGRITDKFQGMEIIVLKAYCFNQSHIVIPYTYESSSTLNTGFKILSSEGMSAIINTTVKLKVFYIEQ